MSERVNRCSRAVPVWTKFKTGSLFCKVEEMEGYFTECQQKLKWRVEPHHHRALLCICNMSFQSHYYVLRQGLEPAAGEVSKKVDAPSGIIRQGRERAPPYCLSMASFH